MKLDSLSHRQKLAAEATVILKQMYPSAYCTLDHGDPWQLLVGTILAAQCTDAKVNTVTPHLFELYPDAAAMALAMQSDVEEIVHPLGFFRQKARSLIEMSRDVTLVYGGCVPGTMEELTKLRGVGRKTANVLLANFFGGGSVIVDTHCKRLSRRLGLTTAEDPTKIERELQSVVEEQDWSVFGTLLVWHGREMCMARNPLCAECPILHLCPEGQKRLAKVDVTILSNGPAPNNSCLREMDGDSSSR